MSGYSKVTDSSVKSRLKAIGVSINSTPVSLREVTSFIVCPLPKWALAPILLAGHLPTSMMTPCEARGSSLKAIHSIAEKKNSRKPISTILHKVAPQADVMGRYALYSHLPQPQDIGGVYKDSKIAPSVVVDQRALPVVIAEHQYVLLPRRLQPLIPPPEFWP